ncbi:MAG: oligoendopeptidase F [Armatimonas sp.]
MTNVLPARAEVPRESTWDLECLFPDAETWEAAFAAVEAGVPEVAEFAGRLSEGPEILAAFFTKAEKLQNALSKVAVWANLHYTADTTDAEAQGRADRAIGLVSRVSAAVAFWTPELLSIGVDTLKGWADSHAALGIYKHYFDQLGRKAAHTRSAEVEQTLALASDALRSASRIHGILTDADLTFAPASDGSPVGQSTIGKLLVDADREVRRSAWESYADAHLAHKNALAQCLSTGVKQNVFIARVRGYESSLHAALEPNYIPTSVFESLIDAFQRHLPVWHRYWGLRRKALGLEKLAPYDVKAPLGPASEPVAYADSVEWIAEGMAPLGGDYVNVLRRGSGPERWVDWACNVGKRMGAFSSGTVGTHPYILMSYNDDLFSLSTLAHELGHSLHSYYSRKTQPFIYAGYGLFAAEVASNFNQALVRAYLLEKFADNPAMLIGVLEEAMSNFHRYFFIMPTLARFEREIHDRVWRGEALSPRSLNGLMTELFTEAFGPEVEIDADRVGCTWMQFSTHLYANFYVWQYATGIAGAHALASRVLAEGESAAKDYLGFLNAGGSLYPLDALKRAGVDLASSQPVEAAFKVMEGYVDRLESLLAS